jgi:hypothetical protein
VINWHDLIIFNKFITNKMVENNSKNKSLDELVNEDKQLNKGGPNGRRKHREDGNDRGGRYGGGGQGRGNRDRSFSGPDRRRGMQLILSNNIFDILTFRANRWLFSLGRIWRSWGRRDEALCEQPGL